MTAGLEQPLDMPPMPGAPVGAELDMYHLLNNFPCIFLAGSCGSRAGPSIVLYQSITLGMSRVVARWLRPTSLAS